ncbi:MAG TPA: YciI family protein [Mycobacteriales bacterium]|nr:YciI family protein [Mycobacteriales bacterium]
MLIYRDRVPVGASNGPAGSDVEAWVTRLTERGIRLAGDPVAPDNEALTVRVRNGSTKVDKAAFLDTGGALLGFDLLECVDQDQAVAVAAEHPLAVRHVLELRPIRSD